MAQRPTVKARTHHGTSSLDISLPAEIVKLYNISAGDVFEVTAVNSANDFKIVYKRVYSQPRV